MSARPQSTDLRRYAVLSICAALATIGLKGGAWALTGSVGLLSDALESLVNLAGALMALWVLALAARPADDGHPHGHGKAEYFSSAFEGILIVLAAGGIAYAASLRLLNPQPLTASTLGLAISVVASGINWAVARVLLRAGRAHSSITLEADAHHLMTDVWTSIGVLAGVSLAWATGIEWLDPVIALLVALNILWTGWQLLERSAAGLMDAALPPDEVLKLEQLLAVQLGRELSYHALRTRVAGQRTFISFHLLVPGTWSVTTAHTFSDELESVIAAHLPNAHVTTHIEPLEDPRSLADECLDRQ